MSVTTNPKTLRVLIVDDDSDHADMLSMLLENSGYDSHVCHDAKICLTAVQRLRPDVVLLDIGMPGMTGYEIAEAIKRDDDLQHIRLFALTGHGLPLDRLQTKMSGFDQHLLKPVAFNDLESMLKTVKTALESVHGLETKMNDEGVYSCTSCAEEIVVPLDLSGGSEQEYEEECPVCSHSNLIHVQIVNDGDVRVWATDE